MAGDGDRADALAARPGGVGDGQRLKPGRPDQRGLGQAEDPVGDGAGQHEIGMPRHRRRRPGPERSPPPARHLAAAGVCLIVNVAD